MATIDVKPLRPGLFQIREDGTGYLMGNRCSRCGITLFPARPFCTSCFRDDQMSEVQLSTRGTLHTYSTVYQSGPAFETPYVIGYVDLPEGVRVFARLQVESEQLLRPGMAMELTFGEIARKDTGERRLVYMFRPAQG